MYYNSKNCENTRDCYNCRHESNDFNKNSCCVKRVEETYFCYPSYYNEENDDCKDRKKGEFLFPCYEGYVKLCPEKSCNHSNKENTCDNQGSNNCHKKQSRCCFCNLFSRW